MEEKDFSDLKDLNISLKGIKKLKKDIIAVYEKTKKQITNDEKVKNVLETSANFLASYKIIYKDFDKLENKESLYNAFNVNNDIALKSEIDAIYKFAEKEYNELLKITNLSFEDFLDSEKSIKELYNLLQIKEKEAKNRRKTIFLFWSIFMLIIPNLFISANVSYFDKIWLSILYTIVISASILILALLYCLFKKKINKIDKRNIYDKLGSFPIFLWA